MRVCLPCFSSLQGWPGPHQLTGTQPARYQQLCQVSQRVLEMMTVHPGGNLTQTSSVSPLSHWKLSDCPPCPS